jgi:hypothetical protein
MPFWALVYLGLVVVLASGSLTLQVRLGKPLGYLVGELVSVASLVYVFLSYWSIPLASLLGAWLIAPLAYSICWEAFTINIELKDAWNAELNEEDNVRLQHWGLAFGFLLVAPGWFFGSLAFFRELRPLVG